MNLPAVVHRPIPDYIYPQARDKLTVRISTAAADPDSVYIIYWPRYETDPDRRRREPMKLCLREKYRDHYRLSLTTDGISAYTRYCFELVKGSERVWLGADGFSFSEPAMNESFFEFLWPNSSDGFTAPDWYKKQIYYQIFPERFRCGDGCAAKTGTAPWGSTPTRENFVGGDLHGIIQGLDYIARLGATCIYLNPIFRAPSNHKYDTTDYYEIDPAFGTKSDLKELVGRAHGMGIRILLDGVFNHCGYYWQPFQELVRNGEASPYKTWFFPHSFPVSSDACNYDCVGHYRWMPKINLNDPDASEYFIRVGEYWIREFDIDGWRLDVADEVPTAFWQRFSERIKRLKPDALLLGETWGDAWRLVNSNRLDTAMNYIFRDAVSDWLCKGRISVSGFDDRMNRMLSLYPEEVMLRMYDPLDSHDTARFLFECGDSIAKFKLAVAMQMTVPGCPAVFYGDEIGLSGDNDPLCRICMEWDPGKQNTELFEWYRQLIALRKESPSLYGGDYRTVVCDDARSVYGYKRQYGDEISIVIINAGSGEYGVTLPEAQAPWFEAISLSEITKYTDTVPAYSVKIYQNKERCKK